MHSNRGFTLIELLVALTILAILLSIVLLSLPDSRSRGNDAAVKANLSTIQVQAIQYFGIGNTYGADNIGSSASCTAAGTVFNDTSTTIEDIIQSAVLSAQKNANGGASQLYCRSNANSFVVAAQLYGGTYWCVDSKSAAVEKTTAPGIGDTSCSY